MCFKLRVILTTISSFLFGLATYLCCSEKISALKHKLFSTQHALDFRDVPGVSQKCREDFDVFLGALDSFEFWAVKSECCLKKVVMTVAKNAVCLPFPKYIEIQK